MAEIAAWNTERYQLDIDNEKQTIQGVKIANKAKFQAIRFVVENNWLEDWEPTQSDILDLCEEWDNPDPRTIADFKETKKIYGRL